MRSIGAAAVLETAAETPPTMIICQPVSSTINGDHPRKASTQGVQMEPVSLMGCL